MRISELIRLLGEFQLENGDVDVTVGVQSGRSVMYNGLEERDFRVNAFGQLVVVVVWD